MSRLMVSAAGVDEWTAWAVLAMPLSDNDSVVRWFDVVAGADGAAHDDGWESLDERIRAGAEQASFDASSVDTFLRGMADTGQGVELVRKLAELRDRMPDLYWELAQPPEPEVAGAADDGFGWVSQTQREQLSSLWGADWQQYLGQQLDYRWGEGWQQHPAEHKTAWLDDLMAQLTEPAVPEPTEPAEQAGPAEQVEPAAQDERVSAALTAAMREVPAAAGLSQEDLADVLARVTQRLQAATTVNEVVA